MRQNRLGMKYLLIPRDNNKTEIKLGPKSILVDMPVHEVETAWNDWQYRDDYIQNAFKKLNDGEREFILTGLLNSEFEALFAEDE